jgi:hypothetical protein
MDELHRSTLVQQSSDADLPQELVHAVNQTYFLHLLATEPAKVLPPGKSLISVVTQEKLGQTERGHGDLDKHPNATVERQVNQVMQNAVWDVVSSESCHPRGSFTGSCPDRPPKTSLPPSPRSKTCRSSNFSTIYTTPFLPYYHPRNRFFVPCPFRLHRQSPPCIVLS